MNEQNSTNAPEADFKPTRIPATIVRYFERLDRIGRPLPREFEIYTDGEGHEVLVPVKY